jgi:hypothetical protein
MIKLKVLPLLLVAAISSSAANAPRVSRDAVASGERAIEDRLKHLWADLSVVGTTRGLYLEGYGAVYTAEVTLAIAPISMMQPIMSQQQKDQVRAKKVERMPELRVALKQALAGLASSLDKVPPDEQIVLAVLMLRYPGEEKLPMQIILQAPKRKLLEAQGAAALDQVIHVTEY